MKKIYSLVGAFCALFTIANAQVATKYAFSQSNGTYTPITGGSVVVAATNHTTSDPSSMDQGNYTVSIPFAFYFNGNSYTSLTVNTNGYVTFGTTQPTVSASTAISGTTAYDGAISAMARDLWGVYGSTGDRTSGSPTITNVTSFTGLQVGSPIRGTGVATGATVTAFNTTAGTITMSANATSTSTGTFIGWPVGEIRQDVIGTSPNRTLVIQFSGMADFSTTAPTGSWMEERAKTRRVFDIRHLLVLLSFRIHRRI